MISKQYIFPEIIQSLHVPFCISAHDIKFYANPPTFRSDSNTATLRFTSDYARSLSGILMSYILGKYFYFYWLFIVNNIPFMGATFTGTISSHG